jgi:hypothetical protein
MNYLVTAPKTMLDYQSMLFVFCVYTPSVFLLQKVKDKNGTLNTFVPQAKFRNTKI